MTWEPTEGPQRPLPCYAEPTAGLLAASPLFPETTFRHSHCCCTATVALGHSPTCTNPNRSCIFHIRNFYDVYRFNVTNVPVSFLHRLSALSNRSGSSFRNFSSRTTFSISDVRRLFMASCSPGNLKQIALIEDGDTKIKVKKLTMVTLKIAQLIQREEIAWIKNDYWDANIN